MKEKKVAIYIRVGNKESQDSLQYQEDSCIAFAKEKYGEHVELELFVDNGVSGLAVKREGYQRLLKEIKSGTVSAVIATEPNRISQSLKQFFETVEKAKIHFHFVQIADDMIPLFMWIHESMLHEHSKRIKEALRHRKIKILTS